MSETFTLKSNNQTISGVLHLPPCEKPPVVVTCHGLFSSKNSDKFTGIAERFSREGLAVIRFDFRGCGESAGSIADTTVSGRLQDLKAVMRFAADHPGLGKQVAILGSSLGGVVALLYGAEYPVA
ncbi:MAG: alpha/beta hydrolase, partial [Deltaproteobacteria bacterium]|nr:alpha/beta hydrolase [Deltaproteobacteria bacterium]